MSPHTVGNNISIKGLFSNTKQEKVLVLCIFIGCSVFLPDIRKKGHFGVLVHEDWEILINNVCKANANNKLI